MPDAILQSLLPLEENGVLLEVTYKNWRGEVSSRKIVPKALWFGTTEWHPHPQWLLNAFDVEKQALRSFAMKDFTSVEFETRPDDESEAPRR